MKKIQLKQKMKKEKKKGQSGLSMAARSQKVVKCLVKSSEPPRGRGDRVRATIPIAHLVLPNRIFISDTFFYLFIYFKNNNNNKTKYKKESNWAGPNALLV